MIIVFITDILDPRLQETYFCNKIGYFVASHFYICSHVVNTIILTSRYMRTVLLQEFRLKSMTLELSVFQLFKLLVVLSKQTMSSTVLGCGHLMLEDCVVSVFLWLPCTMLTL